MNFLNNVKTLKELKKVYKELAKKFHPDLGGSVEQMQKLNEEYKKYEKNLNISAPKEKVKSIKSDVKPRKTIGKATIKARLRKAGVSLEGFDSIEKDEVEIYIDDVDNEGTADRELTEKKVKEFRKVFNWDGFRSGCGSWVLRREYESKESFRCNAR